MLTPFQRSQLHKIDTLIELFKKDTAGIPIHEAETMLNGKNVEVSESEVKRFIEQLSHDGYIFKGETFYIITVKGILFNGYKREFKSNRLARRAMRWYSWILAVGTALAGLYGLYELLKWIDQKFYCWHFFY